MMLAGKLGLGYEAAMKALGRTVALVVAAGEGRRAGGGLPKQYRPLAGRPLLSHTLEALAHPSIDEIVVVIGADQEDLFRKAAGDRPLPSFVIGGDSRQQSVRNGLESLADRGGVDQVLIHDAARPFLPAAVVDRLLGALASNEGAVPVLPVVDTLARREGALGDVVARGDLVRVQTPQAFRFDPILAAHRRWTGQEASDDAQIGRAAGLEVAMVDGDEALEKLTYDDDFGRAQARLVTAKIPRTGLGFDVHGFEAGDSVRLGGVAIPHERGLKGHSDADVVLHSLTDAILGAIGAGDIGDHFPPSDPQWRGADSSLFVERAVGLARDFGARIVHVDIVIICEEPRIGPHRDSIRQNVATLLQLQPGAVSIKATTTEGLGFAGRREGIAAQAIATVLMEDRPVPPQTRPGQE